MIGDQKGGMMEDITADDQQRVAWRQKLKDRAARTETSFLALLRYSVLILAALALVTTVLLLCYGAAQQIGSTEVTPEPVALKADEVSPVAEKEAAPDPLAAKQVKLEASKAVEKETVRLFRNKFRKFQRSDAKIGEYQIADFVWSEDRIKMFEALAGNVTDAQGKVLVGKDAVMLNALAIISEAANEEPFRKKLSAFRDAKKVNVCSDEVRTRTRTIATWDSYSTDCAYWYESPMGCSSRRTVSEPYVEKVCKMQYPDDIEEPAAQLAHAVEQYAVVAEARLENAQNLAEEATAANFSRKAEGRQNIEMSIKLFLGFLGLMFLYLFVAMERHHRSLRRLLDNRG
jgi:hypothetical protein